MVYLNDLRGFKMTHGTTYYHWAGEHRRRDKIHVQKEHDMWHDWSWGSCAKHSHPLSKLCTDQDFIYTIVPFTNSMERGMFKRGITRREHQVCILEARYPCEIGQDFTKSKKSAKRKYENGRCFQAGSIRRNKSTSDESDPIDAIESRTKRLRISDRPVVNDTLRDKVFQGVGSDLIAPWLTPNELQKVKIAFKCDWDWARTWHGGKVKDREVAAKVFVHIRQGTPIEFMNEKYGTDKVFSALWYILPCKEFILSAHKLKHWQSIRKLDRLK